MFSLICGAWKRRGRHKMEGGLLGKRKGIKGKETKGNGSNYEQSTFYAHMKMKPIILYN
jgi:hypothetical protein